jgi:hypothetical protein
MALSDTWHRFAVYFGFAEDRYDDDLDEPGAAGSRTREP